ncbi:hypothetical protein BZL30_6191 [Mycobacterium kansasii]|uniref:Uncharacterized protein n=1 Tax=Mycobacterium kansasii TaxID=1768 RepID=A0A1V3WVZ4_MYCKA|nr:hypothetical protein BZL30_6191 [Mycobacterium kansasii]
MFFNTDNIILSLHERRSERDPKYRDGLRCADPGAATAIGNG